MGIDPASPEHSYRQLAAQLREGIRTGEIAARLPSLTDLRLRTSLATGTIRRAVALLEDEQLVRTVQGRGTFVRRDR